MAETQKLYDDLAAVYDLIYGDWGASRRRHGDAIAGIIAQKLPGAQPSDVTVLDASAGIGTQSLPLAELGYRVRSRDLSTAAIDRLRAEALALGLSPEARPADMREVDSTVSEPVDVVLSFDNAVPHLLSNEHRCVLRGQHGAVAGAPQSGGARRVRAAGQRDLAAGAASEEALSG
jgi:SAM-dependent methyltransferase